MIKRILFTSNLSKSSIHAFRFASMLAANFKATLLMLHVIEKHSDRLEQKAAALFGEKKWEGIMERHMNAAKNALVGKFTSNEVAHAAIHELFCESCDEKYTENHMNYDVIVTEGIVDNEIINNAISKKCDLIVLGESHGILKGISVGGTIKSVLKKSRIPVVIVPST